MQQTLKAENILRKKTIFRVRVKCFYRKDLTICLLFLFFNSPKPLEKSKTSDSALAESQSQMDRQPSQMLSGTGGTGSRPTSPTQMVPLYDKDLIRMFAEVNFIQGEVRISGHMLIFNTF